MAYVRIHPDHSERGVGRLHRGDARGGDGVVAADGQREGATLPKWRVRVRMSVRFSFRGCQG